MAIAHTRCGRWQCRCWQVQAGRRLLVRPHWLCKEHPSANGGQRRRSVPPAVCAGKQFCWSFSKAGLITQFLLGSFHTQAPFLFREAVTSMNYFCGWCRVSQLSYLPSWVTWETRVQPVLWCVPGFFPTSSEIYVKRLICWNLLHYKLYAAQQVRLDKYNISWNFILLLIFTVLFFMKPDISIWVNNFWKLIRLFNT